MNIYWHKSYNHKARWLSYYYQFNEIMNLEGVKNVLEIGVGSGITANMLKNNEVEVTAMDIIPDLNPDLVGDIRNIDFKENSFDLIAAFEILEHLPYEDFSVSLKSTYKLNQVFRY